MTWNAFHNRGEVLRQVVATADDRRDGMLPWHLPGVTDNFRSELDLVAALSLKWHARLGVALERHLAAEPMDLRAAVAAAWAENAEALPGVRMILDRATAFPQGPEMAAALERAGRKECARLAAAAGLAHDESDAAVRAGRSIVDEARRRLAAAPTAAVVPDTRSLTESPVEQVATPAPAPEPGEPSSSLVDRIKAVIAA